MDRHVGCLEVERVEVHALADGAESVPVQRETSLETLQVERRVLRGGKLDNELDVVIILLARAMRMVGVILVRAFAARVWFVVLWLFRWARKDLYAVSGAPSVAL